MQQSAEEAMTVKEQESAREKELLATKAQLKEELEHEKVKLQVESKKELQ